MNKHKQHNNFNSIKESFYFTILFAIVGILWITFKGKYLLNYNGEIDTYNQINFQLSLVYVIVNSIVIYILAYKRIEKTRIINNELVAGMKEIAAVHEEKKFCEISLENQLFMTESLFNEINLGVIGWNSDLEITSVNPYFLAISKYEEKDLLMKDIVDVLIEKRDRNSARKNLDTILNGGASKDHVIKIKGKSGDILEFSTYHMAVEEQGGNTTEVLTFAVDITERNKLEKKLRHLAYYDDITGLPNKHLLRQYLDEKSSNKDLGLAMLYIEIDDYKLTNESLGHEESDFLLKKASNVLFINLDEEDYLARISENEFIIVISENLERQDLEYKAKKILNEITMPIYVDESTIHLSAKIGISIYPSISKSADELLKESHLALHHIKYDSEYHYAFFDEEIGKKINQENYIIKELEKAIQDEVFVPYFQPISYIDNEEIIGLETLIRWIHPEKGFISPAEFIPISEDTGQIYKITDIILEKALKQKQEWNKKGFKDIFITVNISSISFEQGNLELKIMKLLEKYDIAPEELILEITETASIKDENIDETRKVFSRFRDLGIEIALDDFGTGNSSLSRINNFPIKYLKLDGGFLKNIVDSKEEQAIVKTVIDLAQTLELIVIAEGIETKEQGQALLDIGCQLGQGYYLAKPAPAEEIEKMF